LKSASVLPIRPLKGENGGAVVLMSASDVAALWPEDMRPTRRWVYRHVPGKRKIGGQRPFWYKHEVMAWFRDLQAAS